MNKRAGFTLIEVMSSTAILSIILLGAVSVFTTSLLSQSKARVRRVLKLEGNQMLATIEYELKNAQKVTNCTGGTQYELSYALVGDATLKSLAINGADQSLSLGPNKLHSDKVALVLANSSFTCEESAANNAQFVTVKFDLTNPQDGEINTDAGSITESFRIGVAIRNSRTN